MNGFYLYEITLTLLYSKETWGMKRMLNIPMSEPTPSPCNVDKNAP
jgi:hypothetical protein